MSRTKKKKIYPIQYAFVTGIDMGIRYPIYIFNSYGNYYPITKPYELIEYSDHFKNMIKNAKSKEERRCIKNFRDNHFDAITTLISDNIISYCPPFSVISVEDLNYSMDWAKVIPIKEIYSKLKNKAIKKGISIVRVNPLNTSNTCPRCGFIDKTARDKSKHLFICKNCNLVCNDDAIAAWNIHNRGFKMAFGREYINTINGQKPVVFIQGNAISMESLIPDD